uniref:Calpain catalytic domain-containing protein n=1 Tax=Anabas testudineus TaxID=64144 RepID=A0AAQ6IUU5_ANATE
MANKASEIKTISFNQQNFEQLRSQCLQTGSLFCDPTFPASSASLGKDHKEVEWKRPKVRHRPNTDSAALSPLWVLVLFSLFSFISSSANWSNCGL